MCAITFIFGWAHILLLGAQNAEATSCESAEIQHCLYSWYREHADPGGTQDTI